MRAVESQSDHADHRHVMRARVSKNLFEFSGKTVRPADHLKSVALQEVANNGEDAKFSLRSIVSKSGYGFSTFYKFWKGFEDYLLDAYELAVEAFLREENGLISDFQPGSPREYFEMIAQHNMAANQLVPRSLLKVILVGYLKGAVSRLLRHQERQANQIADGFESHFADRGYSIDRVQLKAVLNLHGTFLYWQKADSGLSQDADMMTRLMVDSAMMTVNFAKDGIPSQSQ